MKNFILLFVIMIFCSSSNAQVASFNTSSAKEKIDETNVKFTFTLDGIKSTQEEMAAKFKAANGAKAVSHSGNQFSVIVGKSNCKKTMQSILLECGVNLVIIDGKELKTAELAEYYREQKANR
jgi:uncharacterized protein YpuA (DUF1002 family)